jgi:hypothetical protein
MDESPLFHEIAFEYWQNDLFPLYPTKMHLTPSAEEGKMLCGHVLL